MRKLTDVLFDGGRQIATASRVTKNYLFPPFDFSDFWQSVKTECKKTFQISNSIAALAVLLLATVGIYTIHEKVTGTEAVYKVYIDGQYMGVIRDKGMIDEEIQALGSKIKADIEFIPVHQTVSYTSELTVANAIEDSTKTMVNMVAIRVNGKDVVYVQDQATANKLIKKVEDQFATPGGTVKLADKVDFVPIKDDKKMMTDFADAFNLIMQGTNQKKTYIVSRGDSLWDIAAKNNLTINQLQAANPGINNLDEIAEGQTINLVVAQPLINVETVSVVTREVTKNFDTETRTDDTMAAGQEQVLQQGVLGKTKEVVRITSKDGLQVSEEILSSTVETQPQKEIVVKGTDGGSDGVAAPADGDWAYPIQGAYVSSPYGEIRPGARRPHPGIDLAAPMGTPIYAANNGTVIQAGDLGDGYGNCVRIDHGNGVVTIYAHMSSMAVSVGQAVGKGAHIGNVGMTGDATGPHLHYEVHVNGEVVNPAGYM